jgi:hypothetical protein
MARPRWRFLHSAGAHHDQDVRVTLNTYESRAIDIREGDRIDETAFKALVRDAVSLNASSRRKKD